MFDHTDKHVRVRARVQACVHEKFVQGARAASLVLGLKQLIVL